MRVPDHPPRPVRSALLRLDRGKKVTLRGHLIPTLHGAALATAPNRAASPPSVLQDLGHLASCLAGVPATSIQKARRVSQPCPALRRSRRPSDIRPSPTCPSRPSSSTSTRCSS